jgi:hypothetical protein
MDGVGKVVNVALHRREVKKFPGPWSHLIAVPPAGAIQAFDSPDRQPIDRV